MGNTCTAGAAAATKSSARLPPPAGVRGGLEGCERRPGVGGGAGEVLPRAPRESDGATASSAATGGIELLDDGGGADVTLEDWDAAGASVNVHPAVMLQSVQSVSGWLEGLASSRCAGSVPLGSPAAADEAAEDIAALSPDTNVEDLDRNDRLLAEAERLAPVGRYDAHSVEDSQRIASTRAVSALQIATPKLPPQPRGSCFLAYF